MDKLKRVSVFGVCVFLLSIATAIEASPDGRTLIVTSSNAASNELLVYDAAGDLVQTVPTQGQGGVSDNSGGVAAHNETIAVVNFGSQSVSIFGRLDGSYDVSQQVFTVSPPVSLAFGQDHLYILGTTTVESHRMDGSHVDPDADGVAGLLRADGSAAQVGVVGDQLVISEKSGAIEVVDATGGPVSGSVTPVEIPVGSDTPFGLVTRGSIGYVTIAHSDEISLIRNGRVVALAATGSDFPNGPGQHAPCWIALSGPYLFTSNSPSHTISRLVATGHQIILDAPVAASTTGAPIDIAADDRRLAVIEADADGQSHLTQYAIDENGNLVPLVTTAIDAAANGVAIVSGQ